MATSRPHPGNFRAAAGPHPGNILAAFGNILATCGPLFGNGLAAVGQPGDCSSYCFYTVSRIVTGCFGNNFDD